jgi:histidyl-tRNA synthetase
MGDVVLGELLKERGVTDRASMTLDAFLIAVSGDDVGPMLELAHQLRDRSLAIEYGLRHAAIRKQLELAVARGALRAVIIGPDERAAGEVVVRDLKAGTEERVPIAKLVQGSFR